MIVSVTDFKGGSLEDLGVLAKGKRGTSASGAAGAGEKQGPEGKQGGREAGAAAAEERSLALSMFTEGRSDAGPRTAGAAPQCPAPSVPSTRHLAQLKTQSNWNHFILLFGSLFITTWCVVEILTTPSFLPYMLDVSKHCLVKKYTLSEQLQFELYG